ncbi:fibrillin-1-like, partial [Saccostrea cucullata]|uniref:fibrillin-1-like n=1 Tax=Saccostrea cuccullata TaxID=36930 RepID=UPI002ED35505
NKCPVSSTCLNNDGNYTCQCNEGYTQKSAYECQDIDECKTGVAGCSHGCSNVEGGFNCECEFGYTLEDDRKTCAVVTDICSLYPHLNCSFGCKQDLANKTIGYCFCGAGFYLNAVDKQSCIDVNECGNETLNLCTFKENCVNTVGSYNCSCPIGYVLENDGRQCSVCDNFHYGRDCKIPCNCGVGASTCDNVLGCQCKTGWAGSKCDADIDECAIGTPCSEANQICQNTPGSYRCLCETGYNETLSGQCTDINECISKPCDQICNNTNGGYTCSCNTGFKLTNQSKCEDIDECAAPVSPCDQLCSNTLGSYRCFCREGFLLNATTKSNCHAKTECSILNCTQQCAVRADGSEYCSCRNGFSLDLDNITCLDIDECSQNPCSENCTQNSPGFGYTCSCDVGKKLDIDQRTCIECENGNYGINCKDACLCKPENTASCDRISGSCTCKEGWNGTDCTVDVDECLNQYICPNNSDCKNSNGSYSCDCKNGFSFAGEQCVECSSTTFGQNCASQCTCEFSKTQSCDKQNGTCYCSSGWQGINCTEDVPECTNDVNICGHNASCTETKGSYLCVCDSGFHKTSAGRCENIDECSLGTGNCSQHALCSDTEGSFTCTCRLGFSGDGYNCTGCSGTSYGEQCSKTCSCNTVGTADCDNLDGTCICKDGFNGTQCEFTNECNTGAHNCHLNASCLNTIDSYNCSCHVGFYGDGFNCTGCDDWTYGTQCSQNCTCNIENTADCDDTTGECICKADWNGTKCDIHVEDCRNGTAVCDHDLQDCLVNGTSGHFCFCRYGTNATGECLSPNPTHKPGTIETKFQAETTLAISITPQEFKDHTENIRAIIFQTLINNFKDEIRGFKTIYILSIRLGSLKVSFEIVVYKNETLEAQTSDYIRATKKLLSNAVRIEILGRNASFSTVIITDGEGKNFTVDNSSSPCFILKLLSPCSEGETCVENSGSPSCVSIEVTDYFDLIVGLGIGIPLTVTVIAIIFIICVYCKRRKDKEDLTVSSNSDDRSYDGSEAFRYGIPVRYGSWGPMYSPYGIEGPRSLESNLPRPRQYEQDIWNQEHIDDRPIPYNSEFSWDFIQSSIPTSESFRIQRPIAEANPNPVFDALDKNRKDLKIAKSNKRTETVLYTRKD